MNSDEQSKLVDELMKAAKNKKAIAEKNTLIPKVSRKQQILEMALLLNRAA